MNPTHNFLNTRIVAIETSGRQGSLALARGQTLLANFALPPGNRHATELMPALDSLTRAQGWKPRDIEHIYLSLGPGSFTGLRIAVAIARALAHAIGPTCRIVGVPSLDVIVQNAPPHFKFVIPILDAKRGQVFSARYERDANGRLRRTTEPALVNPAAFLAETAALAGSASIAILGEGVDYHRDALSSISHANAVEVPPELWPGRAETVHSLGYNLALAGNFTPPHALLPIYIRLPEAEEVWRKKQNF